MRPGSSELFYGRNIRIVNRTIGWKGTISVPDIVVTVPKNFQYEGAPGLKGLAAWIAEGDAAGDPETGEEWDFTTWGMKPRIEPGERVYVVCEGKIRGYAPLVEMRFARDPYAPVSGGFNRVTLIRGGGAVAVTIDESIRGFRGWRYRWWNREDERPFPDWKTP
jgi:hypothetical protein